ncbi:MAG: YbaY family lipoprotein [Betaproteobacteria bacterium]|nr:YbaY family lipoprotein [Betaproteobacteria bacterium]
MWWSLVLLPLTVAGCAAMDSAVPGSSAPSAAVSGSVSYRERIALPPDARVIVWLVDVSKADAPATVLGEQVIITRGRQVPFAYAIAYAPQRIDPRLSYAVQARIESGDGRLLFTSDTRQPVLTRGAGSSAGLVLAAAGGAAR